MQHLDHAQRRSLAKQFEKLAQELDKRPEESVRELPKEWQDRLRDQPLLGPITSSGLERLTTIIDRLTWLAYYLNDPNFPPAETPEAPVVPKASTKPTAEPKSTPAHKTIDFGPFDPRK